MCEQLEHLEAEDQHLVSAKSIFAEKKNLHAKPCKQIWRECEKPSFVQKASGGSRQQSVIK